MRTLDHLDARRIQALGGDAHNGAFRLVAPSTRATLHVIATDGSGWDHVSVSVAGERRCPLWLEMAWVKDQFFTPDEAAMQLHPPHANYVNNHAFCLHLWRPQSDTIPLPPALMVGIPGVTPHDITRMTRTELDALRNAAEAQFKVQS
jgi:hypothetical protein